MEWMNRIREKIGLDGVLLLAFALVAIGVGIYDLLGGAELSSAVLVGVLGAFLIESVLQRIRLENLRRDMVGMESRILEGTGLGQTLARDDWFSKRIIDLVRSWEKLSTTEHHPLFTELARRAVVDMSRRVGGAASGIVTTDAFDFRWYKVLTEAAQKTLEATSLVSVEFWESPEGQNYWRQNKIALDRRVDIRRIFICDHCDEDLIGLMGKMHDAGAKTRYLNASRLHSDLRSDFVISDDKFLMSLTLGAEGTPTSHRISSSTDEVQDAKDLFDRLWLLAREYESIPRQDKEQ